METRRFQTHDGRAKTAEARIPAFVLRSQEWSTLVHASPLAAHVYLAIAAHARKDEAWCSVRRLADLTGAWRKSIYDAVQLLKALGWVRTQARLGKRGEKLADGYTLLLPGEAGRCRDQVNAQMLGGDLVSSNLYLKGDIFTYNSGVHIREARIPLPTIASAQFGDMRRKSGIALHLYMILCVYAPIDEYVSRAQIAAELHVRPERIREAALFLRENGWLSVKERFAGTSKKRLPNQYTVLEPALQAARSPEATEPRTLTTPRPVAPPVPHACPSCGHATAAAAPASTESAAAEQFGVGAPPEDLVQVLDGMIDVSFYNLGDGDAAGWLLTQWELLKDYGLWPRPDGGRLDTPIEREAVEDQAQRLVTEFHAAMRGAIGYQATPKEYRLALGLVQSNGAAAWEIVRAIVATMHKTKFVPGSFMAIARYIPEEVTRLQLDD